MKKNIFITILMLVTLSCIFALTAFADDSIPESYETSDTAYTVYTEAQVVEVFNGIVDQALENKPIVFGCDITLNDNDLYLDVPCDVTVDLNGKTLTNNKRVGQTGDFHFTNADAILRIKNGTILSNFCVFIFYDKGQIYAENIDITSAEECVFGYEGPDGVLNFKNCNMKTTSSSYHAICLSGGCGKNTGGETGGTRYEIDGGSYRGMTINCPNYGSYVKNCTVYEMNIVTDTWCQHGKDGGVNEMVFENVDFSTVQTSISDSRMTSGFYDCKNGSVSGVAGGSKITYYTSPSCLEAGKKIVYTTTTGVADEQYPIDNPAKGHTPDLGNILSISYEGGFENVGLYTCVCSECDAQDAEKEAPAIFTTIGYSIKNDGRGISTAYNINKDALSKYQSYCSTKNKSFTYGVFIGNSESFGDTFMNSNGTINNDYSFITSVVAGDYSRINSTVTDFTSAEKDLKLVMALYVIDDGNVSYIQHNGTYDGTVEKGDTALDVVTISKIATLTNTTLPFVTPTPAPTGDEENA